MHQPQYANLLESIIDSPRGMVVFSLDTEYRYIFFSSSHASIMKQIWGIDIALGQSILNFITDEHDRLKAKHNFDRALAGQYFTLKENYGDEQHLRTFWENRYSPLLDAQGNVYGLTVFVSDISELMHTEKKLRETIIEKEILQERDILLNSIGEGLYGADLEGRCFFINPAALKKLGYTHQNEILGQNIHALIHHHRPDGTAFPKEECVTYKTIKDKNQYKQRDWFIRKNGDFFPVSLISTPIIKHEQLIGTIVAFSDISQQYSDEQKLKEMNDQLYMQSITDPLTQLYNRRYLQENGERLFVCYQEDRKHLFSVIMFDIDHFKRINDSFGHDIGDKVLVMIANRIKAELRSGEIFARTGGEEFVVLLPNTPLITATQIAQRIQHTIRKAKITEVEQEISCTISIGVAQASENMHSFSDLLISTDKKLYLAKDNGRDRVEY